MESVFKKLLETYLGNNPFFICFSFSSLFFPSSNLNSLQPQNILEGLIDLSTRISVSGRCYWCCEWNSLFCLSWTVSAPCLSSQTINSNQVHGCLSDSWWTHLFCQWQSFWKNAWFEMSTSQWYLWYAWCRRSFTCRSWFYLSRLLHYQIQKSPSSWFESWPTFFNRVHSLYRVIIERSFFRVNIFSILNSLYCHNLDLHKQVMEIICQLVNMDLVNHPLTHQQ